MLWDAVNRTCSKQERKITPPGTSLIIILTPKKDDKMGRTCITHWRVKNVNKMLLVKPRRKRPHGRTKCRCKDIIKKLP